MANKKLTLEPELNYQVPVSKQHERIIPGTWYQVQGYAKSSTPRPFEHGTWGFIHLKSGFNSTGLLITGICIHYILGVVYQYLQGVPVIELKLQLSLSDIEFFI